MRLHRFCCCQATDAPSFLSTILGSTCSEMRRHPPICTVPLPPRSLFGNLSNPEPYRLSFTVAMRNHCLTSVIIFCTQRQSTNLPHASLLNHRALSQPSLYGKRYPVPKESGWATACFSSGKTRRRSNTIAGSARDLLAILARELPASVPMLSVSNLRNKLIRSYANFTIK